MNSANLEFRRWFMMIFAVCCVGLNIIAFILYKKNEEIVESKKWVLHTYDVIVLANDLYSSIQDMQTAQRGYLLTGDDKFLEPYKTSRETVSSDIASLDKLTHDNREQQERLTRYKENIDAMFRVMNLQISQKRNNLSFAQDSDMEASRDLMNKIRSLHREMTKSERALLQERSAQENQKQKNYVTTLFASAALAILGLIIANGVVYFLTWRRKMADEELKRMNREMEGFTYIASHDLRSPLVNLKGFASEMQYGIDELKPLIAESSKTLPVADHTKIMKILDDDIAGSLHYIHSSVQKMDKLTNAILELSRIGRRNLSIEPVDPARIVRHILDTLHHTITSQKIDIKIFPMPVVMTDLLSLEQIFGNIIDNAIKYLDPKKPGVIEIGGQKTYRETRFWVKDNGRGISPYDMERIFEIYRRGGGHQEVPGEGMGMAYVRTTLRRLGGAIWCDSQPGSGTTFFFTISNNLKKEDK